MLVFFLTLVICLVIVSGQLLEGNQCKAGTSSGICREIKKCPSALEQIKKGELPVICGFLERIPIVCCPQVVTQPTTSLTRNISEQKCKEYSSLVYEKLGVTVLLPNAESAKESQCVDGRPYIIGGTKAEPKEFPHMAVLGYGDKNSISWGCGASLISERFVLTAAHCVSSRDWGAVRWVRLGDLNIRRTDDITKTQDFGVSEIIRHPQYKPPAHYNDIALLKLDKNVKFDGYVRPACLHVQPNIPKERPHAIGWGLTDWIGSEGSDDLLKVRLSFQDPAICNDTFSPMIGGNRLKIGINSDSMLCVGELNGGKDTCKGDSGGPLEIRLTDPYCMYDIIGITSFGSICGSRNSPAIYTRVSHYVPWIESIVWK